MKFGRVSLYQPTNRTPRVQVQPNIDIMMCTTKTDIAQLRRIPTRYGEFSSRARPPATCARRRVISQTEHTDRSARAPPAPLVLVPRAWSLAYMTM